MLPTSIPVTIASHKVALVLKKAQQFQFQPATKLKAATITQHTLNTYQVLPVTQQGSFQPKPLQGRCCNMGRLLFIIALALNCIVNTNATCPCIALNTYCQYAAPASPCPRAGFCHGTTTPCGCQDCPGPSGNSACKGCGLKPQDRWCNHPSQCPDTHTCCTCLCHAGDAFVGYFDCKCKNGDKALPNDAQSQCCGKPVDQFGAGPLWCAKSGTTSATKPMCSSHDTDGVPTPIANFYPTGHIQRCAVNCNTAFCDNKPALPCDHISSPPRCTGTCQPHSFLDTLVDEYERALK